MAQDDLEGSSATSQLLAEEGSAADTSSAASSTTSGSSTLPLFLQALPPRLKLALGGSLMTLVCIIFAGYSIITHAALGSSSSAHALVFAWVRDAIGSVGLLGTAYVLEARKPAAERRFWPARSDVPTLLLCGLTGVWGSQGLSALVLTNVNGVLFSLFEQLLPLVSFATCLLSGEEVWQSADLLSWGKLAGMLTSVGGAILVALSASSGSLSAGNANLPLGMLFMTLQILLGGSYNTVQKPLLRSYPALVVAGWGYTLGLGLLSLCVVTADTSSGPWSFSRTDVLAVAYAGLCSSFLAYAMMALANQLAGPLYLTCFFPTLPIATCLIAYFVQGTVISLKELLGGAVIAGGLGIVIWCKMQEGSRAASAASAGAGLMLRAQGGGRAELQLQGVGQGE